jgi:hypothetical protein
MFATPLTGLLTIAAYLFIAILAYSVILGIKNRDNVV